MNNQLSLFDELLKTEEKQYKNSRAALLVVRKIRHIMSRVDSVEGADNPYHSNFDKISSIASNLSEAVHRAYAIFYLVSADLDEFRGKSLQEVISMLAPPFHSGPSKIISISELYNTIDSMGTSIKRELYMLYIDSSGNHKSHLFKSQFTKQNNAILNLVGYEN